MTIFFRVGIYNLLTIKNNNKKMIDLAHFDEDGLPCADVTEKERMDFILSQLVTKYSEDVDFLGKVNKITFGLISRQ